MPTRSRFFSLGFLACVTVLCSCAVSPYRFDPVDAVNLPARAITRQSGAFTVATAVPSAEEAARIFGIPVYDRGIQPVWLQISNASPGTARFAVTSIDPLYFSPLEVAYMHRKLFSRQGWMDLEKRLYSLAMPRMIAAGETVSGFVFTHTSPGTKAFNTDVFYASVPPEFEHFTFFVTVPGFTPDHAEIDFAKLYDESARREVTADGLRAWLSETPCCSTNLSGDGQGRPVNIVLVADGMDLLQALLSAGWSETSYERNETYLEGADYLYGRPPDGIFRKKRDRSGDRAELAIWLSPAVAEGKPVWMAQLRHAIGRRFELGEYFFGVQLDPDVDDGRNYLLQNLWYSQSLEAFAFSQTALESSVKQPLVDFRGDPFIADGYRIVMWVPEETVALAETRPVRWDRPANREWRDDDAP